MRWLGLICFLFSSCTAYNYKLIEEEITPAEIEKINVDDKILLVLREEVDEKMHLRGKFKSFNDEKVFIAFKKEGQSQTLPIPLTSIRRIRYDENVPLTVLKAFAGIGGTMFLVAVISFLNNPDVGASGI